MTVQADPQRDWHRLFGLLLTDFFHGLPVTVDVERDLSQQAQLLDVILLLRGELPVGLRLPDGLAELALHNLITFKSLCESLDAWALKELIGYYVAYRKYASPSTKELLPESHFRLYAVCAQYPHNLAQQVPFTQVSPGVYDCRWGTDVVRVVVVSQLPQEPHNAPLHLFASNARAVKYGKTHYRPKDAHGSRVIGELFHDLRGEGLNVSYTRDDFDRDYLAKFFPLLTAAQRTKLLKQLTPEDCRAFVGLMTPEDCRAFVGLMTPEDRRAFAGQMTPEERLEGLTPEQLQELVAVAAARQASRPARPRKRKS